MRTFNNIEKDFLIKIIYNYELDLIKMEKDLQETLNKTINEGNKDLIKDIIKNINNDKQLCELLKNKIKEVK